MFRTKAATMVLLIVLGIAALPAAASRATPRQILALSDGAAHDPTLRGAGIGAAFIEGPWAIASWYAPVGERYGQAVFFIRCDHWLLAKTSAGAFTTSQLSQLHPTELLTRAFVAKLRADSIALQRMHTAYSAPVRPSQWC